PRRRVSTSASSRPTDATRQALSLNEFAAKAAASDCGRFSLACLTLRPRVGPGVGGAVPHQRGGLARPGVLANDSDLPGAALPSPAASRPASGGGEGWRLLHDRIHFSSFFSRPDVRRLRPL